MESDADLSYASDRYTKSIDLKVSRCLGEAVYLTK